jgi:hypothetical protein
MDRARDCEHVAASTASRAVMAEPDFGAASTTSVPSDGAMMRLRCGKWWGGGRVRRVFAQHQALMRDTAREVPMAARVDRVNPVPTTAMVAGACNALRGRPSTPGQVETTVRPARRVRAARVCLGVGLRLPTIARCRRQAPGGHRRTAAAGVGRFQQRRRIRRIAQRDHLARAVIRGTQQAGVVAMRV